jgi:hypothetical protein
MFAHLFRADWKPQRGDEVTKDLFKQKRQKKCANLNPLTGTSSILLYEKDTFTVRNVTRSRYGFAGRRGAS